MGSERRAAPVAWVTGVSVVGEEEREGILQEPTAPSSNPDPAVLQPKLSEGIFTFSLGRLTLFSLCSGTVNAQKSRRGLGHHSELSRPSTDFLKAFESWRVTYS